MLNNIQALRAIAAILVLLYHSLPHLVVMNPDYDFVTPARSLGFMGVDIFFVISGFVISLTTTNKPRNVTSIFHFTEKRAARIYLGYWPFLLLTYLIIRHYTPGQLKYFHLRESVLLYTFRTNCLLPVAWSLIYELYFYLLFIPIFFVPKQYLGKLVLVLFFGILVINLFFPFATNTTAEFLANPYLLEFLGGAILYHYQSTLLEKPFLLFVLPTGIIGMYYGNHNHYELGMKRIMTFGIFALSIFWVFLFLEKNKWYIFGKNWIVLGDSSYTLYLAHVPFLYLFYFIGLRDWLTTQHPIVMMSAFIGLLWFIIMFSIVFYRRIEYPLYQRVASTA